MPITDRDVMVALKADHSFSDVQAFMRRMYADRQFHPTQRDEFAKAALSGRLAGTGYHQPDPGLIAAYVYQCADAMLTARGGPAADATPDLIGALQGLLLLVDPEQKYPGCEEVVAARVALAKVGAA